ncbi:Protein-lysine N-methyltransferase rrg1 [Sporothrix epigloea]|uniref:Protein-lysine N-methyltransferase rrg1 n=1 Tax=Sporothrix epigloea TaxID=1892477 RepID=A0ABP0E008_9PEZI
MHQQIRVPPDHFPAMRQQPSFTAIMACLDSLGAPKSGLMTLDDNSNDDVWDCATPRDEIEAYQAASAHEIQRYASAVSRYLSSIIMSDLAWLPDEDDREALWAAASRRISERCGRMAMGDITRRWPLSTAAEKDGTSDDAPSQIDLIIKEPALVGDSLGFKTWGTSYAMARMLPALAYTPGLCHLQPLLRQGLPVLELGAGTGLLGLAAAALWRANVVLSDLAEIVPNLAINVERNSKIIQARGGCARTGVLQWGANRSENDTEAGIVVVDTSLFPADHQFTLILAADPIYDDEHPALLASAIDAQLALEPNSATKVNGVDGGAEKVNVSPRAVVMVPLRDQQTEKLAAIFVSEMAERQLVPLDEGEIAGQDSDWGSDSGGSTLACEFTCLWWVFHRVQSATT